MTYKTYKRRLLILSSLAALLFLVYILSLVFDPQRTLSRSAAYTWLEPRLLDQADRIVIRSPGLTVNLLRRNNSWLVSQQGNEYPARQLRVGDLLAALSRRAAYPVQAASISSHGQLGLEEGISRITVRGGAGLPLLDLLLGKGANTGRELYLRKADSAEVRSGVDIFTAYTGGALASWYDLRLFPEIEAGDLQRLTVYPPTGESYTLTRSGNGWNLTGVPNADNGRIDSYIRGILAAQGEDFAPPSALSTSLSGGGRLILEMGNGALLTLNLGPEEEAGRRLAEVSGFPYLYVLADWAAERLFREAGYFSGP